MAKRRTIITKNKQIYQKLNMLNLSNEVLLKDVKRYQIDRILKTINKDSKVIDIEKVGDYFLLKKLKPVNYNVYFK